MSITLVRHTRLLADPGLCYGTTDIDVAASFADEARQIVARIPACEHLLTSPLQRCAKLAALIAAKFDVDPIVDNRIAEMDFGSWEGRPWSSISKEELDAWADDFLHARPHGGESVAMLRARTIEALADCRNRGGTHIVVCHAGVIKAALATGDTAAHFDAAPDFGDLVRL